MAKYEPMVEETTETTGTGSLVLAGATSNHRTFASAFSEDDYLPYMLRASDGGLEWGYGRADDLAGTPDLVRSFIMGSTNAGAALNLPSGAHIVSCGILPDLRQRRGMIYWEPQFSSSLYNYIPDSDFDSLYWGTEAWDSDNHFSPDVSDVIVPAYVDEVRVTCGLKVITATASGRVQISVKPAATPESIAGYPSVSLTGGTEANADLFLASGVIRLQGTPGVDAGIKIKAYQTSGSPLTMSQIISTSFLQVDFVG